MKEYLQKVYDLLKNGWIKGAYAGKKTQATETDPRAYRTMHISDSEADCFCTIGALNHYADTQNTQDQAEKILANCLPSDYRRYQSSRDRIINYNDAIDTKHEDILKIVQCAIDSVPETSEKV